MKAILGKIYAGALHGSEAAQITPAKFAKLSAAVIDAFRSRNDNHNVDRFFASVAEAKNEIDPVGLVKWVEEVKVTKLSLTGEEVCVAKRLTTARVAAGLPARGIAASIRLTDMSEGVVLAIAPS